MYIRLTFFNATTLFIIAITVLMVIQRVKGRVESNLPLIYYGVLVFYTRAFEGSLNQYWVFAGVVLGLFLRFEFLGRSLEKVLIAAEFTIFGYIVWRCLGLVLLW